MASGTLSRSRVKSLIEQGCAHRNGDVVSEPAELVRSGATYALDLPPPVPATPQAAADPFPILYEDTDLIVLDKPAGLVVHPAPGNEDGTLVNALLAHCGDQLAGIGGERRPGIVHRLDKDTSGIMVVAKTQFANTALTAAFAARDLDRAYLALVWGVPNPPVGDIQGDIGRDKRDRKRMAVVTRNGKPALTHYRMLARLARLGRLAGVQAGHRAYSSDPRASRQPRQPGGRRSALPAACARDGTSASRAVRGQLLDSPARRFTRPDSGSLIREPARP